MANGAGNSIRPENPNMRKVILKELGKKHN